MISFMVTICWGRDKLSLFWKIFSLLNDTSSTSLKKAFSDSSSLSNSICLMFCLNLEATILIVKLDFWELIRFLSLLSDGDAILLSTQLPYGFPDRESSLNFFPKFLYLFLLSSISSVLVNSSCSSSLTQPLSLSKILDLKLGVDFTLSLSDSHEFSLMLSCSKSQSENILK